MDGRQGTSGLPALVPSGKTPSPAVPYRTRLNAPGIMRQRKARGSASRRAVADRPMTSPPPGARHQAWAPRWQRVPASASELVAPPAFNGSLGADYRQAAPVLATRMFGGHLEQSGVKLERRGGNLERPSGKGRRSRKHAGAVASIPATASTLRPTADVGFSAVERAAVSRPWIGALSDMPIDSRPWSPIRRRDLTASDAVGRQILKSQTVKRSSNGAKIIGNQRQSVENQVVGRNSIGNRADGRQGAISHQAIERKTIGSHTIGRQSVGQQVVAHRPMHSCVEEILMVQGSDNAGNQTSQQWLCGADNVHRAMHRPKTPAKNWMSQVGRAEIPPSLEPRRYALQTRKVDPSPLDRMLKKLPFGGTLEGAVQESSSLNTSTITSTAPRAIRTLLSEMDRSLPVETQRSRLSHDSNADEGGVASPDFPRANHRKRRPSAPMVMRSPANLNFSLRLAQKPLPSNPGHVADATTSTFAPSNVGQTNPDPYHKVVDPATSTSLRPLADKTAAIVHEVAPGPKRKTRRNKKPIQKQEDRAKEGGLDDRIANVESNTESLKHSPTHYSEPVTLLLLPSTGYRVATKNPEAQNGAVVSKSLLEKPQTPRTAGAASNESMPSPRRSSSHACLSVGAERLSEPNVPSSKNINPQGRSVHGHVSRVAATPEVDRPGGGEHSPAGSILEKSHADTTSDLLAADSQGIAGGLLSLRISPTRGRPSPASHPTRLVHVSKIFPNESALPAMGIDRVALADHGVRTPRETMFTIHERAQPQFSTPEIGVSRGDGTLCKTPSPLSRPSMPHQHYKPLDGQSGVQISGSEGQVSVKKPGTRGKANHAEQPVMQRAALPPPARQPEPPPPPTFYRVTALKAAVGAQRKESIGGKGPPDRIVASKVTSPPFEMRPTGPAPREYIQRQSRPAAAKVSKQSPRQGQSPLKLAGSIRYKPNDAISMIPRIVPRKVKDLEGKTISSSPEKGSERFKIDRLLQKAIYGGVYVATQLDINGQPIRKVALKAISKQLAKSDRNGLQENPWAEMKFQQKMAGHPNVLVFDFSWEDGDWLYLVMAFAEYQDLFELLRVRRRPLSESQAKWLFRQIVDGAVFLHRRGIGFRDHSLENILIFLDASQSVAVPKITDPGQAIFLEYDEAGNVKEMPTENLFGKSFRAPEVYLKGTYHPQKVDTFCLGWMLFFCVTRAQAFERALYSDPNWNLILHGKIEQVFQSKNAGDLSRPLKTLLSKMLHPDPRKRPTPAECLEQPWFKNEPETPIYLPLDAGGAKASSGAPPPTTHMIAEPLIPLGRLTPAVVA